jgi:hypothetical protein
VRRAAAIALAAWGLWLCPAPPAAAAGPELAEFDRAVAEARRALAQKEAAGVLEALGRATAAAWRRLPFTAVEVHLVAAPPEGFGEYLPRVDNVYRPSEPLILYLEPVGFAVTRDADEGVYRHNLAADFNLVDAWGHVVSGRRRFGRFQGETRHFPDRLPLTFTYSLSGLPPGEYRLETILRDLLGEKTHTVVTPIRIESP